jgi:hypothetical protein
MNGRCSLSSDDRVRMAQLPVALPVRPAVDSNAAHERLRRMLRAAGITLGALGSGDDDVLAAYQELRERTGMHPADLAVMLGVTGGQR